MFSMHCCGSLLNSPPHFILGLCPSSAFLPILIPCQHQSYWALPISSSSRTSSTTVDLPLVTHCLQGMSSYFR
jgi:hypothetical protein